MLIHETKVLGQKLEDILKTYKPHYEVMEIDSHSSARGITIIWNPAEIMADAWISLPHILIGLFRQIRMKEKISIYLVYGPHTLGEREAFLNSIRMLNVMHTKKYWLLGEDYNMIMNLTKKKGGLRREELEMELFMGLITKLRPVDIPTVNGKFTCNSKRGVAQQVAMRLDRFVGFEALVSVDVFYEGSILPTLGSYHWPISMEVDMKEFQKKHPFQFETFWLRDPNFLENAKGWWEENEI